MTTERSKQLFAKSCEVIPGGVNSPVRACQSVAADPIFVAKGKGSRIWSEDGTEYIDMVCSWGPLIFGHANEEILAAVHKTMGNGTTFGAPTELELRFAEAIVDAVPSIEKVRAVSSGTEATMSALRVARGYTKRSKIVKVDGGYHGHADFLLVAAGSGAATLGIPGSAGVPDGSARDTLLVPYNDLDALRTVFSEHQTGGQSDIAAVIIEPIAGNMGLVPPADGYLAGLREITQDNGALLIFDEVISGFRAGYGGAQKHYGVSPDLTCLGKIIGGGFPAGAFGGRAEIMDVLAPTGAVYQAGTLSGNPIALAAGLQTMEMLRRPNTYEPLAQRGAKLAQGYRDAASTAGIAACVNHVGSTVTLFFTDGPVTDYESAKRSDTERYGRFFVGMRDAGVFLPPSQFEANFVSLAHSDTDIDDVIAAAHKVLSDL